MFDQPASRARKGLRAYIIVSALAFLSAGSYVGWVFYSRWQENKALAEKAAAEKRLRDQRAFEMMGGNNFEILAFSAVPTTIRPGETASLCYSVSHAKSVKLDPPAQPVWPAVFHCVQVSPRATTTYTLTAEDGAGHAKTSQAEVQVR